IAGQCRGPAYPSSEEAQGVQMEPACHLLRFRGHVGVMNMMDSGAMSDERLWELSRDGDGEAFGRIVERYQSLVCAVAYSAFVPAPTASAAAATGAVVGKGVSTVAKAQ